MKVKYSEVKWTKTGTYLNRKGTGSKQASRLKLLLVGFLLVVFAPQIQQLCLGGVQGCRQGQREDLDVTFDPIAASDAFINRSNRQMKQILT